MSQSAEERKRKWLLTASLVMNLGLLVYFKYANFFVENVNDILQGFGFTQLAWVEVALPIGISFYTFQTLTYAIDVYRKVHAPLKKVSNYMLYIMSFPQMIAGPIVRFTTIADQITERKETIDDKLIGFYRFCIGLAKKVLIANVMAEQADLIMDGDLDVLTSGTAWLGILAYTFQIYFDFSGYSDMAIGLGRMMGFRFPENFNSPYVSQSISEFWRRWHITLGTFMRDYLYIPLGGNRVSTKSRLYANLWIVFLLSGLWHGASWNFVLWGAYHGFILILDRLFLVAFLKKTGSISATIITFFLVVMGWVIFRIEDMARMKLYFAKLFSFDGMQIEMGLEFKTVLVIAIFFAFAGATSLGKRMVSFFFEKEKYKLTTNLGLSALAIVFFVLSLSSVTSSGFNPFIYFRF
jgi:alginate O-acetyltransferase complex protein AlgI